MTKARPILFNTEMVQALLDGRKTMTRRVIKKLPNHWKESGVNMYGEFLFYPDNEFELENFEPTFKCPYGEIGDLLYVRETYLPRRDLTETDTDSRKRRYCYYKATTPGAAFDKNHFHDYSNRWKPSVHMPRWASRLTLEITNVKVERLLDITEEDARLEGVKQLTNEPTYKNYIKEDTPCGTAKGSFKSLWQSINGKEGLESNPWVWVVEFKVIKQNVDEYLTKENN